MAKKVKKRAAVKPHRKKNLAALSTLPGVGSLFSKAGKTFERLSKKRKRNAAKKTTRPPVKPAAGKRANTAKIQKTLQRRAVSFRRNAGRKNPVDSAAARYEFFHGRPPAEVIDIETEVKEHTVLSGIGKLVELEIFAIDGSKVIRLGNFKGALLAQDEDGKQLYIEGGDQSVNVRDFGITQPHELEILGALESVVYFTRKDHLRPEDGGIANYHHKFGGEGDRETKFTFGRKGSRLPLVGYDVRNGLLSILGGGYELPDLGIDG